MNYNFLIYVLIQVEWKLWLYLLHINYVVILLSTFFESNSMRSPENPGRIGGFKVTRQRLLNRPKINEPFLGKFHPVSQIKPIFDQIKSSYIIESVLYIELVRKYSSSWTPRFYSNRFFFISSIQTHIYIFVSLQFIFSIFNGNYIKGICMPGYFPTVFCIHIHLIYWKRFFDDYAPIPITLLLV